MKRNLRPMRLMVWGLGLAAAALALIVVIAVLLFLRLRRAQEVSVPPAVFITDPAATASWPAGDELQISVTATGTRPIVRVELLVDGEPIAQQASSSPGGDASIFARLATPVTDGWHQALARAVDDQGVIGQSAPLSYYGSQKTASPDASLVIRASGSETLEDLATKWGTDADAIARRNPNIDASAGAPAAGTMIQVPLPAQPAAPAAPAPAAVPVPATLTLPASPPQGTVDLSQTVTLVAFARSLLVKALPTAPDGLQAQIKDCRLVITWIDHATNESRYDIWTAAAGRAPMVAANAQPVTGTGPAWIDIAAPGVGDLTVWVEAVNAVGSQPSNAVSVHVDPECAKPSASLLQVEALDMNVQTQVDRAYCYVSLGGSPDTRVPADATEFIDVRQGQAAIASWAAGDRRLIVPAPASGSLEVAGECWGWANGALSKLGAFDRVATKEVWNGSRLAINAGGLSVGVGIQPFLDPPQPPPPPPGGQPPAPGDEAPKPVPPGVAMWVSPAIPRPYDIKVDTMRSPWGVDPKLRHVSWKWDGNSNDINGFTVELMAEPIAGNTELVDGSSTRSVDMLLPDTCGLHIRVKVSAGAGGNMSYPSDPYEFDLPPCQAYAMVEFLGINLIYNHGVNHCGTVDGYFKIGVNNTKRAFYGGCGFNMGCQTIPLTCGYTSFHSMLWGPTDNEIVVSIPTENIELNVWTYFWDYNTIGADDIFGMHSQWHKWDSYDNAIEEVGCGKDYITGAVANGKAESVLSYHVTIYPNKCGTKPPYIP